MKRVYHILTHKRMANGEHHVSHIKNKFRHMKTLYSLLILTFFLTSCEEEKTVYVASQLVDCEGAAPQKCMQVKENKEDEWTFFYDTIEGFTYEEGFEYVLKVKISKIKNPPTNTSSLSYTLLEVISKEKTAMNKKLTQNDTAIDGEWSVTNLVGFKNETGKSPHFTIKEKQISGNTGCNSFGGSFESNSSGLFKTGMLRMTKMYCAKTAKLETAFTTALSKSVRFSKNNNLLTVFDVDKNILFTAASKTGAKEVVEEIAIKPISIRYSATSRGLRSSLNLVKDQLIYEELQPNSLKTNKKIKANELQAIYQMVEKLDLESLEKLEPPSKAHQYDGAAGGGFSIIIEGKTYRTPTFDYGNPPEAIKILVEKLVALKSE